MFWGKKVSSTVRDSIGRVIEFLVSQDGTFLLENLNIHKAAGRNEYFRAN